MKNLIILFLLITLGSCGGMKQTATGLDNVGYLMVYGEPQRYPGGVLVSIDGKSPIVTEVISQGRAARKVELPSVKIPSGKHTLSISYQGKVVYQRQIFLSSQETYKAELQ